MGDPSAQQNHSSIQTFENPVPDVISNVSTLLTITASGIQFSLSNPEQSTIPIHRGTDTSAHPEYLSTRAKRNSGNSILRHSKRGNLLATSYKWGPKDPRITSLDSSEEYENVKWGDGEPVLDIQNKWYSKAVTLTKDSQECEWKYIKTEAEGKKRRLLVLVTEDPATSQESTLAVLLRTETTRTPGTSKWDGGNGGQLILDSMATSYLSEELIVATCLMMLKKEVDRTKGATAVAVT